MRELKALLEAISDETLDHIINDLVEYHNIDMLEIVGAMASRQWRLRHPDTIPPCMFRRAQRSGGFPECYSGPKETIDIETGCRLNLDALETIN